MLHTPDALRVRTPLQSVVRQEFKTGLGDADMSKTNICLEQRLHKWTPESCGVNRNQYERNRGLGVTDLEDALQETGQAHTGLQLADPCCDGRARAGERSW
jgi:hypothetical protein